MKRFFLLVIFLFLAPVTLGMGLFLLEMHQAESRPAVLAAQTAVPNQIYAALPEDPGSITTSFEIEDARPEIIRQYLEAHNSPLLPYADFIFEMSVQYELDYRLMVAIAQCESNLCKKSPPDSYNCWGFENGTTKFLSWEQAIEQVAKTLKEKYIDQGLVTPEEIMPKYAPPSVDKGGPWAKCVNQFLGELE